jgi:hypothetical protein
MSVVDDEKAEGTGVVLIVSAQSTRPQPEGEKRAGAQMLKGFTASKEIMIHARCEHFLGQMASLSSRAESREVHVLETLAWRCDMSLMASSCLCRA